MIRARRQRLSFRKKKMRVSQKSLVNIKAMSKFLIVIALVTMLGVGLVRLKYMFVDSEYFMIKEVVVTLYDEDGSEKTLPFDEIADQRIEGTSIFFIDLSDFKEKVVLLHPEFKDIVVRRVLPNKLIVQAILRKAVLQIRSDRYYFVDREGVLLPDVKNFPDPNLPIITGIGINLAKIQTSKFSRFEKDRLSKALSLIEDMRDIKELQEFKLKMVDITDPGNLSFYIDKVDVEIKIGNTDFRNRLKVLATVLSQFSSDINNFKYIDLRFEDPIVGP
ncbi:MAG: cell division protein FtsQ/DivIB [Candidatus Omnitrophica bacterium]|nr:cell division protein FtsQ/DivIB [Candidatus Omnitrophota bacterium]